MNGIHQMKLSISIAIRNEASRHCEYDQRTVMDLAIKCPLKICTGVSTPDTINF